MNPSENSPEKSDYQQCLLHLYCKNTNILCVIQERYNSFWFVDVFIYFQEKTTYWPKEYSLKIIFFRNQIKLHNRNEIKKMNVLKEVLDYQRLDWLLYFN